MNTERVDTDKLLMEHKLLLLQFLVEKLENILQQDLLGISGFKWSHLISTGRQNLAGCGRNSRFRLAMFNLVLLLWIEEYDGTCARDL